MCYYLFISTFLFILIIFPIILSIALNYKSIYYQKINEDFIYFFNSMKKSILLFVYYIRIKNYFDR